MFVKPQSRGQGRYLCLRKWLCCEQGRANRCWFSLSNVCPANSLWFYSLCPAFSFSVVLFHTISILSFGWTSASSTLFTFLGELCFLSSWVFENCLLLLSLNCLSIKFLDLTFFSWYFITPLSSYMKYYFSVFNDSPIPPLWVIWL